MARIFGCLLALPLAACKFDPGGAGSGVGVAEDTTAAGSSGAAVTTTATIESSHGSGADTSSGGAMCLAGALGCPCDNGTCAQNLVCVEDVCVAAGFCGDGVVDHDEACDEADDVNDDGCNADCTLSMGAAAIFAGSANTCALSYEGTVRCWGEGTRGRLGLQSIDDVGAIDVPSDHGAIDIGGPVKQIAIGTAHMCALLVDGRVRCWGVAEGGRLGYGPSVTEDIGDDETPASVGDVPLPGSGRAVKIASNGQHTCAVIDVDRKVACWGIGNSGRLGYGNVQAVGDDETVAQAGMVDLGSVSVVDVGAGAAHTCALLDDGGVTCWGDSAAGRLGLSFAQSEDVGDDETPAKLSPIELAGPAVALSVGALHSCALLDDGRVTCWGTGAAGRLGTGSSANIGDNETPVDAILHVGAPVEAVAAGRAHTCLLLGGQGVRCFGEAGSGQLGTGATTDLGGTFASTPDMLADVMITNDGRRPLAVATGRDHTCARITGGAVRCWGAADKGQLGYGNTTVIGDNEPPSVTGDVSCWP